MLVSAENVIGLMVVLSLYVAVTCKVGQINYGH